MLIDKIKNLHAYRYVTKRLVNAESRWFDYRHGVLTRATRADWLAMFGDSSKGFSYLPTRPGAARKILSGLPVKDFSTYTFVDFGSGKGRMLLLAAEHPFERVQGVEYDAELHAIALGNLANMKNFPVQCRHLETLHCDARDYQFPDTNLVLYVFNPFGEEIMSAVLTRLCKALAEHPRDVILLLVYPDYAYVVDRFPCLRLVDEGAGRRVYRS
jgi:predicted RNA methylase